MKKKNQVIAVGSIAIVAMFWALSGCGENKRAIDAKPKSTGVIVHEDPKELADKLRLPSPVASARWAVVSAVPDSRSDFGPSDYRLYAVVSVDSAQWPTWERALTPADSSERVYLMEKVAEKLLPPEWLSSAVSDSLGSGRLLSGTIYRPDSIAAYSYQSGVAVRHGKYLFMSFYTM